MSKIENFYSEHFPPSIAEKEKWGLYYTDTSGGAFVGYLFNEQMCDEIVKALNNSVKRGELH